MSIIIEADEKGILHIPTDTLSTPHRRFHVQVEGTGYRLTPVNDEKPLWQTLTPQQRVEDLRRWIAAKKPTGAPPIPDEALRRESIYD